MPFNDKTRRKVVALAQQAVTAGVGGNTFTWDIPKTGLLAGIYVYAFVDTSAAGWAAGHAKGVCQAIRRVRLIANSGIDLINLTGSGLNFLRWYQEDFRDANASWAGDTVPVAGATYNLNFFLPVSINRRDPLGMFMLQNEATLLQLQIETVDAVTLGGAGGTYDSLALRPYIEIFSVPQDPKDWPPLNVVHQIVEETRVTAAGQFTYQWPRGNTYAQVLHIHDTGAATDFSDNFTTMQLLVNQSDVLWNGDTNLLNMEFAQSHGVARPAGVAAFDFLGTSGLGAFGSARDMLYSAMITEIDSVFTITAAGQLTTVRRQLVALKG